MSSKIKGIVLAGGKGTRLSPLTKTVSKHLLPVYDKPMIFYSLSILFLAGINEICIITTPEDLDNFKLLLGDGRNYGVKFEYIVQKNPDGIASAFNLASSFLGNSSCYLILGDNLFYGDSLTNKLKIVPKESKGSTIFVQKVNNPSRYGVVDFDEEDRILSIKEKPKKSKSKYALTGIYFFDNRAIDFSRKLKKSKRGEFEITDIFMLYLKEDRLSYEKLGRGINWFDAGTYDSLLESSQFIQSIQHRQGNKIGCIEEIAFKNKWINENDIIKRIHELPISEYSKYLEKLVK